MKDLDEVVALLAEVETMLRTDGKAASALAQFEEKIRAIYALDAPGNLGAKNALFSMFGKVVENQLKASAEKNKLSYIPQVLPEGVPADAAKFISEVLNPYLNSLEPAVPAAQTLGYGNVYGIFVQAGEFIDQGLAGIFLKILGKELGIRELTAPAWVNLLGEKSIEIAGKVAEAVQAGFRYLFAGKAFEGFPGGMGVNAQKLKTSLGTKMGMSPQQTGTIRIFTSFDPALMQIDKGVPLYYDSAVNILYVHQAYWDGLRNAELLRDAGMTRDETVEETGTHEWSEYLALNNPRSQVAIAFTKYLVGTGIAQGQAQNPANRTIVAYHAYLASLAAKKEADMSEIEKQLKNQPKVLN
jgi:hypothetical protein